MDIKNCDFAKIAKNTYKITAEQCARWTGSSGLIQEDTCLNLNFLSLALYSKLQIDIMLLL
jgi:hypothetical protein